MASCVAHAGYERRIGLTKSKVKNQNAKVRKRLQRRKVNRFFACAQNDTMDSCFRRNDNQDCRAPSTLLRTGFAGMTNPVIKMTGLNNKWVDERKNVGMGTGSQIRIFWDR